jgi:hypothetical protein
MFRAMSTGAPLTPYMQLRMSDGSERHVTISDYGQAEEALRQATAPFSAGWAATAEGTLIQLSQVVEARRVDLGDLRIEQIRRGGF